MREEIKPEEIYSDIAKDFQMSLAGSDDLFEALTAAVAMLIETDMNKLVFVLYRLDISETVLLEKLQDPDTVHARVIATMIVERQLEKIKSRRQYRRDDPIDDNEKW